MIRSRLAWRVSAIALTAAMLPAATLLAGPAGATTFNVTSAADSGPDTLRAALLSGDDVVEIQVGLPTITVSSELFVVSKVSVTINGNGATLSGPGVARGVVDDGGVGLTINDLTITGFGGSIDNDAAPIVEESGAIALHGCTITGNTITTSGEDAAGAVLSEGGGVTVSNCTITGNRATTSDGDAGGGILSEGGGVVLETSVVSGNTTSTNSGDAGGGILSEGGGVTVRPSTINCNTATTTAADGGDAGGAINSEGGGITINDTTVVGNTASAVGDVSNSLLSGGGVIDGTGNTISDDKSSCAAPPPPPPPPPPGPGPATAPAAVIAPAHFTG